MSTTPPTTDSPSSTSKSFFLTQRRDFPAQERLHVHMMCEEAGVRLRRYTLQFLSMERVQELLVFCDFLMSRHRMGDVMSPPTFVNKEDGDEFYYIAGATRKGKYGEYCRLKTRKSCPFHDLHIYLDPWMTKNRRHTCPMKHLHCQIKGRHKDS